MNVILEKAVCGKFPGAMAGITIAQDFSSPNLDEISDFQKRAVEKAKASFNIETISQHPRMKPWRDAYKTFGIDPSKNKPSAEALVRRAIKNGALPSINPPVDFYNAFSVWTGFPSGGEDLDKVKGDVLVKVADGTERFTPLGGGEVEHPKPGEVVYADSSGEVMTRTWNWREGDLTKITEATQKAVLGFDCLPPTSSNEAISALEIFDAKLHECFPNCVAKHKLLTADDNSFEVIF